MDWVLETFGYTDTSLKAQIFLIYIVCAVLVTIFVNWMLATLFIVLKPFTCAAVLLTFFRPDIAQNVLNEDFLRELADKTKTLLCEISVILLKVYLKYLRQLATSSKRRLAHYACETPPQYDVSEKMRNLFELKQKQREATKAYFQKIVMNPYRPKEDEVPFDPVLFRYNALMTYNVEYYKPNLKNTTIFWVFYILPIVLLSWFVKRTMSNREKKLRAGEVAYKDRNRGLL